MLEQESDGEEEEHDGHQFVVQTEEGEHRDG